MPETFVQALALPGLWMMGLAALTAGIVRGFSGFGTSMIFLPIAALVVDPVWAILALVGMDCLGPLPILKKTNRAAEWRIVSVLLFFCALSLPLGVWLLTIVSPETYRFAVSGIAITLVVVLVSGVRMHARLSNPLVAVTGAIAGVSGGVAGIPGPPVILLHMASTLSISVIRANTFMFLFCFDFMLLIALALAGEFVWTPLLIGFALAVPNGFGNLLGQQIFDPQRATLYRNVAYGVVVLSALVGLPIWDR